MKGSEKVKHDFGEKTTEYSPKKGGEIPVWQSPKYISSRAKAVELIESNKYGLTDSDFWILMNETKSGKMAYTGLIISHNACLKINDTLPEERKFLPSAVTVDKCGYKDTLVFSYANDHQYMYEVGEVSASNCKNAYPYAMAWKRLFDRVVLKLSKIAFDGIYSEAEADEFRDTEHDSEAVKAPQKSKSSATEGKESNVKAEKVTKPKEILCSVCGKPITQQVNRDTGEIIKPEDVAKMTKGVCPQCYNTNKKKKENSNG